MFLRFINASFDMKLFCRSYSINHVPRTNLMLLAVDSQCICDSEPAMNMNPVEELDILFDWFALLYLSFLAGM
jgi:hypothetical protein